MIRDSMSRPRLSVPSRYSADGGLRRWINSCAAGSGRPSQSALIARKATSTVQPSGSASAQLSRRPRLATVAGSAAEADIAHPRIEHGIEHVDQEVDEHEARGDERYRALHQDQVAIEDTAQQQPADAGQREDLLDDHRAADQPADIEPEHGNQR